MKSMWSKVCITAVMSVAAFSVSAQRLSVEEKVAQKFKRIERLASKLESRSYSMNRAQLRNLNKKLAKTLAALKGKDTTVPPVDPTPIPVPIPVPQPIPTVSITGTIEGVPFMFQVVDAMDLVGQCVNRGTPSRVDEMTVSVDYSSPQRNYTSGWWTGEMEICRALAKKAVSLGLIHVPTQPHGYEAVGLIEDTPFSFQGYSLNEIMMQCMSFHQENRIGNVDDILFYEDLEIVKKRTSGWWRNSNELCNVIIQHVK